VQVSNKIEQFVRYYVFGYKMCATVHSIMALVTVLRLFCAARDRGANTPFPCLQKFPDTADTHAPTNNSGSATIVIFPAKG